MPRKKPDKKKIKSLLETLLNYPDGIWLRKLSKESKIPLSTTHYYLDNIINPICENLGVRNKEGKILGIRLIRLKSGIRKRLEKEAMDEIIELLKESKF